MRRIFYPLVLIPIFIVAVYAASSLSVTIPAVPASQSPNIVKLCNPLISVPGSVIAGSNGTVTVTCPNGPAMQFLPSSETPSITPPLSAAGYVDAYITYNGYACSLPFSTIPSTNNPKSGTFLNHTITFSASPTSTQLLSGTYNYCFDYINAFSTGLGSLTVTWTP